MMNQKWLRNFSLVFFFIVSLCIYSQETLDEESEGFFYGFKIESVSKYVQSLTEVPATMTVVTSDTILTMGFNTIAEVLNFYSMSMATFYDRRYEFGITRGLYAFEDYNTRFLVLVDGTIVNEPSNNFAGLDRSLPIPLELVERIEITYGPYGVLYGTSNLGGIINIVTKSPSSMQNFFGKLSLGSFKTRELKSGFKFSTSFKSIPLNGYFFASSYDSDGIIAGIKRGSDGLQNYGGSWEKRADFERSPSLFGKLNFGELTLTGFWGYRKKGEPYAPWGDVYGENSNWVKDEFSQLSASLVHSFSPSFSLSSKITYDDYSYLENDTYSYDIFFPYGYFWSDSMKARRISAEASALLTLNNSKYLCGGYFKKEKLFEIITNKDLFSQQRYFERGDSLRQRAYALYALYEQKFSNDIVSIALNYVKYNYTDGEILYRASYIHPFSDKTVLKVVGGMGFRVPSYYEYAYFDDTTNLQNPTLKSEKSPSLEISLSFNPQLNQNYTFAIFKQNIKNLIDSVTIEDPSQIQGDVIPVGKDPLDYIGFFQYQNTNDIYLEGAAFSVRWNSFHNFSFYSNVSYQYATEKENHHKKRLRGSPKWTFNLGTVYEDERFYTSFGLSYIGDFLTSDEYPIEPQKICNSLDGRFHFGIKNFLNKKMKLTFTIINPFKFNGKIPLAPSFVNRNRIGKRNDISAILSLSYGF